MVLVIDNYDSFTYNLVQYLGELNQEIKVFRNDKITIDEIREMAPDHILISPGPGDPDDGGVSQDVIRELGGEVPILGVCLGHQCIGNVFGGTVTRAPSLMHGKVSQIHHNGDGLFTGLPNPFTATRYHSLVVEDIPDSLEVTCVTADEIVMGLRHKEHPIVGVQFHPESILTEGGHQILQNFLEGRI
ncbi:MAG: aminodeoxychorismate/anthranilate synthase component II [Chloroflexota bacterium]